MMDKIKNKFIPFKKVIYIYENTPNAIYIQTLDEENFTHLIEYLKQHKCPDVCGETDLSCIYNCNKMTFIVLNEKLYPTCGNAYNTKPIEICDIDAKFKKYSVLDRASNVMSFEGKLGYMNEDFDFIVPCIYDYMIEYNGALIVGKGDENNRKYGVITKENEPVLPIKFTKLFSLPKGNLCLSMKRGKSDYIVKIDDHIWDSPF